MRTAAIPALILCMTACQRPELPASGPIQSVRLPGAERWLLVTGSEQEGAQWSLKEGRRIHPLSPPPVMLFPHNLSPSPDGRFLAVISVGEGHPILDLLSLDRLLEGTHGTRSLRTIDPYPGSIEVVGWEGSRLRVRSDRPLIGCCDPEGRVPGAEVSERWMTFLIEIDTGKIRQE